MPFSQILYAGEGESRKPDENAAPPALLGGGTNDGTAGDGKAGQSVVMKGHEFVQISYHMPASCDGCTKQLWAPFRPPPAMECKSMTHVCPKI